MPVPPAVSCASDRASAPRLAAVQKRREVGHCFNVRKVARCFCRRQKCAYEGGNVYTPVFRRRKATRRSGRKVCLFPAVVKGICSRSRVFCGRVFARCGITKREVFPFAFAWCGRAKSKIRSHGVLFTAGVFPILSIAHSQEGGAVCSVVKGICYCPVRFAAGILLFAELQNGRFFPSATEAAYKIPVKRQKVGQKCGQIAATGRKIIEKKIII